MIERIKDYLRWIVGGIFAITVIAALKKRDNKAKILKVHNET